MVREIPYETEIDGLGTIFFFVSFMIIVSLVLMQVVIAGAFPLAAFPPSQRLAPVLQDCPFFFAGLPAPDAQSIKRLTYSRAYP